MTKNISIKLLDFNKGQLAGLPKNPRFFRDYRFEAMKKSISDSPEMLDLRELIVFPSEGRYIVVCGNLRLRACKDLGYKELPCKVLPDDTPVAKLREYATKDNVSFGENDMDIMENEWDKAELQDWGIEFAPEKEKDEFKDRFNAISDDNALYPLIPKYDEKHELFIIISGNEVDSNWLRERLDMQHMKSYKTGKISKSNVIDIKDVRHALQNSNSKPSCIDKCIFLLEVVSEVCEYTPFLILHVTTYPEIFFESQFLVPPGIFVIDNSVTASCYHL